MNALVIIIAIAVSLPLYALLATKANGRAEAKAIGKVLADSPDLASLYQR
tara:strand:+ start:338 stop:487 length:150 start_codon:yes stop_codon:yes gene_type:complete